MRKKPRGQCLIINNEKFVNNVQPYREGSNQDAINLDLLFEQLGFRVTELSQVKNECRTWISAFIGYSEIQSGLPSNDENHRQLFQAPGSRPSWHVRCHHLVSRRRGRSDLRSRWTQSVSRIPLTKIQQRCLPHAQRQAKVLHPPGLQVCCQRLEQSQIVIVNIPGETRGTLVWFQRWRVRLVPHVKWMLLNLQPPTKMDLSRLEKIQRGKTWSFCIQPFQDT